MSAKADRDDKSLHEGRNVIQGVDPRKAQAHRRLEPRHIHVLAIASTIGTAIFVGIGSPLTSGGPLSLLLGYIIWCTVVWCINECQAELVVQNPVDSSFVQLAGRFVDEAMAVAVGYSYFIGWAALVCFEITAFCVVIEFWHPLNNVGRACITLAMLLAYGVLNLWNVKFFGEMEFYSGIWKIILITGLIMMTFVVMVGGNPKHYVLGFAYWKNPGAMAEYIHTGALGRFEGLLACIIYAAFSVGGPDILSLAAGEAKSPRKTMRFAFRSVMFRLVFIYVVGALCVGIIVPYNNEYLLRAIANGAPGAAKSPYVIGMQLLNIKVLPHIVNAGIATSIFSAGNAYVFCASRALYGLAIHRHAPPVLTWKNRNGVPVLCVLVVMMLGVLTFMQLSHKSNVVLNWWINLVTASQLLTFITMSITHIRWAKAMSAQRVPRSSLYYRSSFQPFAAWYGLIGCVLILLVSGYTVFLPGLWDVPTFIFAYFMIPFYLAIFLITKLVRRTKWKSPLEVDLVGETREIDVYEDALADLEEKAKVEVTTREVHEGAGSPRSKWKTVANDLRHKLALAFW